MFFADIARIRLAACCLIFIISIQGCRDDKDNATNAVEQSQRLVDEILNLADRLRAVPACSEEAISLLKKLIKRSDELVEIDRVLAATCKSEACTEALQSDTAASSAYRRSLNKCDRYAMDDIG